MKLRHAAALALVGWYLMVPSPEIIAHVGIDAAANYPLSTWYTVNVCDTASDCKTYDMLSRQGMEITAQKDPSFRGPLEALKHAQCVATDDPRLKQ
jgi:hypothetical protein